MIGIYILSTSLFYLVLLTIVYFSKKRVLNIENKIFKLMLASNLIGIILDVLSMILVPLEEYRLLALLVNKFYLIYLLTWITLFTFYTYFISKYDVNRVLRRINVIKLIFYFIVLSVCFLPLNFVVSDKGVYSYGASTTFIYMYSLFCIGLSVFMLIKKIKSIGKKKYIPLFSFLGIGTIVLIIQNINPYLLLMTALESFVTFMMYFTIENPDMQIIEEYREIKDISKKQNIDKVMFLHNTTQSFKYPLMEIERDCEYLYSEDFNQKYKEVLLNINYNTKKLLNSLTKVYDPNLINHSDIKSFNDNYETRSYESIFKSYKTLMNENINYSYKIDSNLPSYLYGDILNIKDILKRIVKETINKTKEGNIKINLETIIDNNVCRIVIKIIDNGEGYTFKEIGNLLQDGIFKEYNDDLVKINGIFVINSEKNVKTEKIIVIDQLIDLKDSGKLANIENSTNKKKVMIVDNSTISNDIVKYLKKYDLDVIKVKYGVECLNKVRNYEKYDLIIINDDIEPISGFETYKKLNENIIFKIPVVMLSNEKDFKIKDKYLKEGINEIINLPIEKESFMNLVDKYLQ